MLREKTDLKMARTGGYRLSAVWRPWGVTLHATLQNKSIVCSGSRVTISTVMKLHGSVKQGGIIVKTYTKSTCSHLYIYIYIPHTDIDIHAPVPCLSTQIQLLNDWCSQHHQSPSSHLPTLCPHLLSGSLMLPSPPHPTPNPALYLSICICLHSTGHKQTCHLFFPSTWFCWKACTHRKVLRWDLNWGNVGTFIRCLHNIRMVLLAASWHTLYHIFHDFMRFYIHRNLLWFIHAWELIRKKNS